jgi:hypothetical protein
MVFNNADIYKHRTLHIARLTLTYVQELIEEAHLNSDIVVEHLEVPPVQVAFDTMDDESIARLCAQGIYRAIIQSL